MEYENFTTKENKQDLEIVTLKGQLQFMKEQQDNFSREVLETVKENGRYGKTLSTDIADIMSALKDDNHTSKKGIITITYDNSKSIREIKENLRVQRNLYTVVGTVVGAIGTGLVGFIKYLLDR